MPKNQEKTGFPMPTAKNRFHILVLHLKKHIIIEKNTLFRMYFYCTFTIFSSHIVFFNASTKDFTHIHLVTFSIKRSLVRMKFYFVYSLIRL